MPSELIAQIARQLDGALIALDFDGTLAPIVLDPAESAPVPGAVAVLSSLAQAGAQIAIVTGRDALTALALSGLGGIPGLVVSGLHGAEIWRDQKLQTQDEPAGIKGLRQSLPPLLARIDERIWLEDKRLSLVIHTRRAADPERALALLAPAITTLAEHAGLEVHPGHLVHEIRLAGLSKADAIAELLQPGTTAALYAGDDFGDLPAIAAIETWAQQTQRPGLTVGVGSLPELKQQAHLLVQSPADLVSLLRQLLAQPQP